MGGVAHSGGYISVLGIISPIQSKKPLVFVGPVYAGRLPRVMNDYIQKVKFSGTKQAYFVVTCASTAWQTVEYVKKLCGEKLFFARISIGCDATGVYSRRGHAVERGQR